MHFPNTFIIFKESLSERLINKPTKRNYLMASTLFKATFQGYFKDKLLSRIQKAQNASYTCVQTAVLLLYIHNSKF